MRIRAETTEDVGPVARLLTAAFGGDAEARLVERLRAAGKAVIALVAEDAGCVVGHVLFSPVEVVGAEPATGLGLAPMAVAPERQGEGIGSRLVEAGIAAAQAHGAPFVVVLGHPGYYPRFRFERADARGLGNEYGADEAFFVRELVPGGVPAAGGLVRYGAEFAGL